MARVLQIARKYAQKTRVKYPASKQSFSPFWKEKEGCDERIQLWKDDGRQQSRINV